MARIYKTKWYIFRRISAPGERPIRRQVLLTEGAFQTESRAWDHMFQNAPPEQQDPDRPYAILQERKLEFQVCFTIKGERLLKLLTNNNFDFTYLEET